MSAKASGWTCSSATASLAITEDQQSRSRPGEYGEFVLEFPLAACIDAARASAGARGVRLENLIRGPLPVLRAHPARFTRLFEVLLTNEIDLLGEGKSVSVTAAVNRMADTPVSITFEIRDDGPGLPEEALRPIFDPFCIRPEGTEKFGLDLLGVYFLVHHHGGHIEAGSVPGEGTTYRLEFPLLVESEGQPSSSRDFVTRVLMNDALWERLLAGD